MSARYNSWLGGAFRLRGSSWPLGMSWGATRGKRCVRASGLARGEVCRQRRGVACGQAWRRRFSDERGQMTVELAVVLPVAIVIAVIAVNAMTFFSECAEFDRVGRNAVRVCATSPAYGQDVAQSVALVETAISEAMGASGSDVEVSAQQDGLGYMSFEMTLLYRPTLFSLGLKDEVLGVPLPVLRHEVSLVADAYKPGMLL